MSDSISNKEFEGIIKDISTSGLTNEISVAIACAIEHALHSDVFSKRYGYMTVNALLHYVRSAN